MFDFFFDNFLGRTIGRFIFGLCSLVAMVGVLLFILAMLALAGVAAVCLVWGCVNGFLYLSAPHYNAHVHDVGQQAIAFLVAGTVGFGLLVALQGAVWDGLVSIKAGNARSGSIQPREQRDEDPFGT